MHSPAGRRSAVLGLLLAAPAACGWAVEDATDTVRYLIDADGGESLNSKSAVVNEEGQRAGWFWSSNDGVAPPPWEQSTLRVYDGTYAWRSVMNDPDQYRNEQKPIQGWDRDDGARFFRFAFTAGPEMARPTGWTTITQWWQLGTSPPVGIWLYDDLRPRLRTKDDLGSATAASPRTTTRWIDDEIATDGAWHNYLVKIKWGTTDGELALWKWDGEDWVSKYSVSNTYIGYHDAGMEQGNYTWKMGGYRAAGQGTWDMFYDGMAYGTTRSEALAGFVGSVPSLEIEVPAGIVQTQSQAGHPRLGGSTSVRKTGGGMLRLNASNEYSGGTRVEEGQLSIASAAALPGWNEPGSVAVSSSAALIFENSVAAAEVEVVIANASIAPGGQIGFDTSAGNRTAVSLAGGVGLRKQGAGTLSLTTGPNTFTGPTTVAAGTLRIPGTQTITSSLRVDRGGQLHLDGDVTLAAPFSWVGDRGLRILSGDSIISGTLTLGDASGSALEVAAGASLTVSGTVVAAGANSLLLPAGAGELRITGTIVALGANQGFGMAGPATAHLLARNTFGGGPFSIDQGTVVANTLFDTGTPSSLGVAADTINLTVGPHSTATLRYVGEETSTNRQVRLQSDIAGSRSVIAADGTGRLTFSHPAFVVADQAASRQPQSLVLAGSAAGQILGDIVDNTAAPISLVKEGVGDWTLSGTNTFSGPLTVAAGRLTVDGDQSAAPGPVSVERGATLGGRGTIGGATTLHAGASLMPGAGSGSLAFAQSVTLGGGATYIWEIADAAGSAGGPAGWDLLAIDGQLDIAATAESPLQLDLRSLAGQESGSGGEAANFSATLDYRWTIASAAGGISGFAPERFRINLGPGGEKGGFLNDIAGGSFSVAQNGTDLQLVFTATREPTPIRIDVPGGDRRTQTEAGHPLLAGSSAVEKAGEGTLVLEAVNTATGPLSILDGAVAVATESAIDRFSLIDIASAGVLDVTSVPGGLSIATGQTLGGSGTVRGSVIFGSGATLSPGSLSARLSADTAAVPGDAVAVPEPGWGSLVLFAPAAGLVVQARRRPSRFRKRPRRRVHP